MKKWKKSGRKRKPKTHSINLYFTVNEYNKINEYRIRYNYSWTKLASMAIKESM